MKQLTAQQKGFTLIEMAVILVILGIVAGGIIAGRSIVKASELKSVISNINDIKTSIKSFRLKYNALPGDFRNAKDYWPDPKCVADAFSPCNGNGNGKINEGASTAENFRAWNHLSLGGFMRELYTGTRDSLKATLTVNMPPSGVMGGGFQLRGVTIYGRSQGNSIQFSSEENNDMDGGILAAGQAFSIDEKIDDGLADSGQVFTTKGYSGSSFFSSGCVTSPDFTNAISASTYIKDDEDIKCRMFFWFE